MQATAFRVSAALGFFAVALGAFGAHGLEGLLERNGMADNWETAAFYHLTHAIAMLVLAQSAKWRPGPWWCLLVGVLIFSGSLYLMGITGIRRLGMITPLGGASLLAGWGWLALSAREPARSAGPRDGLESP